MGSAAAIFDLDRTLLRGSSTQVLNEALFDAGLSSRQGFPGQSLFVRSYELLGESLPAMGLARAAVLAARDKPVPEVARAAEAAADRLEELIVPYVPPLLEMHRDAGKALVLATTTPAALVEPLARRLGFDHVIATRYQTRLGEDGVERYTGRLDGEFVWSLGKLRAVRRWATEHDVSLRDSCAYSDSVYDLPLLTAVGHPTAVNPDPPLLSAAALARWPILHLDAPAGVPKLLGFEPLDVVKTLFGRRSFPYARFDIAGTEHIPGRGPAIVACNHRSYFDVVAFGLAVFEAGRHPRGMAKKELVDAPVVGPLFRAFGAIRVDRERVGGGAEAFQEAEQALRAGEVVVIAPQGTIPRGAAFFEPKLQGRSGVARLAAATGAPVIPLGVWGSEEVWPRSARLPKVTAILNPPRVRIRIGPPVEGLTGTDMAADTAVIMDAISSLLPEESTRPRTPTAEEIARMMPPGTASDS